MLAYLKLKNSASLQTLLSGQAAHVTHRPVNSYREASPPGLAPHEANPVAPEKSLKDPRITRQVDSDPKIPPSRLQMVALRGSATAPIQSCSSDLYRCFKRRLGRSLKSSRSKRDLVPARKQVAYYNVLKPGTKGSLLGPKEFQDLCSDNIVLMATDNTTVVAYIKKEGDMRLGPL